MKKTVSAPVSKNKRIVKREAIWKQIHARLEDARALAKSETKRKNPWASAYLEDVAHLVGKVRGLQRAAKKSE